MAKINKSAKTGKIVSEAFAKENPDTTYTQKKKATPKKVVEKWMPLLGEKFDHDGEILEIVCFNPLEVNRHFVLNGCQSVERFEIEKIENAKPLTKSEVFIRLAQ